MRGVRRQSREAALQAVFMCDFNNNWDSSEVTFCYDHFSIPEQAREYAERIVFGLADKFAEVEERITCASEHWSINRMGRIDRCLLRIATFEILYCDDIPTNVAINEAIEIAKMFGSNDSPMFINGVLDKIAAGIRKIEKEKIDNEQAKEVLPADTSESELVEVLS